MQCNVVTSRWMQTARMLGPLSMVAIVGCTHLELEDCPDSKVLGNNELGTARLRTSHYRVVLADRDAAAARVVPYALMSAYAYRLGPDCEDAGNNIKVSSERAAELKQWLALTTDAANKWTEEPTLGLHDALDPNKIGCEDDHGLMFHVWHRKVGNQQHVVVAFRGTSGHGDWVYGNLWWFTRFFLRDNQLTRARSHIREIIDHYDAQARVDSEERPRFVTTGHSLGGSLAQHILYSFPDRVEQAIVFDPSSVTGFADVPRENQITACSCEPDSLRQAGVDLGPEARILRVYETYEILTNLRIFHKLFFEPERHVQELRFPFPESSNQITRHGMQTFATNLFNASGSHIRNATGFDWFASRDSVCTKKLIEMQRKSCQRPVAADAASICPK